jgi:putative MATE family efflux protein
MQQRSEKSAGPVFLSGSVMRHVLVMTSTGAIGLVSIFLAELIDVLFLSMLGDTEIVAAVGYSGPIVFLTVAAAIGLSIATVSLVAPAIGARDIARARRISGSAHVLAFVTATVLSLALLPFLPAILGLIGAKGRTAELALSYLSIVIPSLPPLASAMVSSSVLRSAGDARRAMHVTLGAAVVTVVLDPILIFGFGMGLQGAAIATVVARVVIMGIGLYSVWRLHDLIEMPSLAALAQDIRPVMAIALPAIATNTATPIANAIVTAAFSPFGDAAVAGWAVIGRVQPVAFGFVFAMSGSVGPIIGQNLGARNHARMREAFTASLKVVALYTMMAWFVLALLSGVLVSLFKLTGDGAMLLHLYCVWLAPVFGFQGALFVCNAVFNTLRRPQVATAINWARAILGTLPFTWIGGALIGVPGVLIGQLAGGVVFGLGAVWLCYRMLDEAAGGVRPLAREGGLVAAWLGTPY